MKREIIRIDEDKCNGCGLCVPACAEGAIQIIDGKARLVSEVYCDGLGACLGECPTGALTVEVREAEAFDPDAVEAHLAEQGRESAGGQTPADEPAPAASGCPGTAARKLGGSEPAPSFGGCPGSMARRLNAAAAPAAEAGVASGGPSPGRESAADGESALGHWPVQLALVPETGPIWDGAEVLVAADCVAFAMGDFHRRLLGGRSVAIGCPKLDETGAYTAKLARIFAGNDVAGVTVARMEVPCCGFDRIVRDALAEAGKAVPLNVVTVSVDGKVLEINGVKVA